MSSSVYLSHTPDWTTHYLTACHYPTSDGTTSVWTAQTWLVLYLSLMTSPSIYRKTVSYLTTLIYLVSPMYLLPLTSTSEIVRMVSRRGYSTSHESHACGMPGVRFPRAVMTNHNCSPRKNSRGERRIPQRFAHSYLLHTWADIPNSAYPTRVAP